MILDFKDQIKQLGERVVKLKDLILTEEATKNAFIMPFLQNLGYDVFNPIEVVPEYITDIGTKKGEKIDYAIFKDGFPTILIECKHWAQNLSIHDGQLLRYFHVSKAKFGILTNGICYRFYSDLVEPNKMDEKPFLEFNIHEIRDSQIEELKKFHKANFDIDSIVTTASELKFTNELKQLIHLELTNPSETFIKHLTKQVYPGVITAKILEQFSNLTRRSINQYFNDLITDRLKTALTKETEGQPKMAIEITPELQSNEENKIVTTDEELEALKQIAIKSGKPHQVEAPDKIVAPSDAKKRILAGEKAAIRFKVREKRDYILLPESEITTVVDVRPAMAAKRSAMAAHESQVGDFGPFLAMPAEQVEAAFGQESFRRRGRGTNAGGTAVLENALPL